MRSEGFDGMKALVYRWKAYNYADIIETFEKHGIEVVEIWQDLSSYDEDDEFADKLRAILREGCSFVFSVNYFGVISDVCYELGIRYVCWTCDNPLISMYHESVFNETNLIFTFDMSNYFEFRDMGVNNIHYLPLAVNVDRIDSLIAEADDLSYYENDVCFVGSIYEKNSYDEIVDTLPEYLRGYFDCAIELQCDVYGRNIIDNCLTPDILMELEEYYELDKSPRSFSDIGLIFETTTLGFKVASQQRINVLTEMAAKLSSREIAGQGNNYKVSMYSEYAAKKLPGIIYRGTLEYHTDMPKAFYQSKINLNFTIPNIKTGLPLRYMDILGAGGFLLTDYRIETPQFFNEGEDLVSFHTKAELMSKVDHYLAHDDERQAIAKSGRDKVKKYHNYDVRIEEMMSFI